MKKYDVSKVLDFAHEMNRMCEMYMDSLSCGFCPYASDEFCDTLEYLTEEKIRKLQEWSDSHPEKPELSEDEKAFLECAERCFPRPCSVSRGIGGNLYINTVSDTTTTVSSNGATTEVRAAIRYMFPVDKKMFACIEEGHSWSLTDLRRYYAETSV